MGSFAPRHARRVLRQISGAVGGNELRAEHEEAHDNDQTAPKHRARPRARCILMGRRPVRRIGVFVASLLAIGGVGVLQLAPPAAAASGDLNLQSEPNPSWYGQEVQLLAYLGGGFAFAKDSEVDFYDGAQLVFKTLASGRCGEGIFAYLDGLSVGSHA